MKQRKYWKTENKIQKKETEGNNTKLEKESIAKKGKTVTQKEKERKRDNGQFLRTVEQTLWCLAGYAGALAVWLFYIGVRYGLDNYISGIQRLFGMTESPGLYRSFHADGNGLGLCGKYVLGDPPLLDHIGGYYRLCHFSTEACKIKEAWVYWHHRPDAWLAVLPWLL